MIFRHLTAAATTLVLTGTALAAAAPAQASAEQRSGNRSLAAVLAADGHGFDRNARDFDILDGAVLAVLKAKPDSPVNVLTKGKVRVTAFAPTDAAFRGLAEALTGKHIASERRVFATLAKAVGVNKLEKVLEYHVVPGATVTYKQAKASDGAKLNTALGSSVTVRVRDGRVVILDGNKDTKNARVIPALANINKGNKQIAHGISQVLLP